MEKVRNKRPHKIFRKYEAELEDAVGDCAKVLDVGCGSESPVRKFTNKRYYVGVDVFGPSIERSRQRNIHDEYVEMDVMKIGETFKSASFDCVLALDLIEHLTRDDALRLITEMEKIASRKVIIFTPNGFFPQSEHDNNPWQLHKSGWTTEDMREMGYNVMGINGWKPLRGEQASIRFRPRKLWEFISRASQLLVRGRPELAFQLLCVKEKKY